MKVMVKRIYEPAARSDGFRILVDRLWPRGISKSDAKLALWLPDGYESLQNNPLYAVRFANENIWDESTGYNILGTITISKTTTGIYESGEDFSTIEINK